jgi:hypothetical protein
VDQRELATEGAWRRCSGQLRGRRASLFDSSLLAEALEEVELGDGERRGRGSLNRRGGGSGISPEARRGGAMAVALVRRAGWLDAATGRERAGALKCGGDGSWLRDAPHSHCATTGSTGRR